MSYNQERFGMTEGYFVPRGEIIAWLNELLKLNITKIEQLGSGAVYCQVLDVIYPGKISMSRVNWKAKHQYEFLANLKMVQTVIDKMQIKKHIEIERIARAKEKDNLEFSQWLKRHFDLNCPDKGVSYDAEEKRGQVQIDWSFADKIIVPKTYRYEDQSERFALDQPILEKRQKKNDSKGKILTSVKSDKCLTSVQTDKNITKLESDYFDKPVNVDKAERMGRLSRKGTFEAKQRLQIDQNQVPKTIEAKMVESLRDTVSQLRIKLKMLQSVMNSTDKTNDKKVELAQQILKSDNSL